MLVMYEDREAQAQNTRAREVVGRINDLPQNRERFLHRRLEPSLVADPEHEALGFGRSEDPARGRGGHRKGLLAEDRFACGKRGDSLLLVQGVRRRDDHRVDRLVRQNRIERRSER